jgi:hypothetical protein
MGGWHEARLRSGGSVIPHSPVTADKGPVIGLAHSSRVQNRRSLSLFKIARRRTAPARGGDMLRTSDRTPRNGPEASATQSIIFGLAGNGQF